MTTILSIYISYDCILEYDFVVHNLTKANLWYSQKSINLFDFETNFMAIPFDFYYFMSLY